MMSNTKRLSLASILLFTATTTYASSNFNIAPTPGIPQPTSVVKGGIASAYYTITNNTNTTRSHYAIQGLPNTVTQNTSNPSNCAHPITRLSHQSCVLQLDINGTAKSNFALCKNASCTTAATPLDVSLTTTPPPMVAAGYYLNGTSQFPLLATSTDGGTAWSYTVDSFTPILPGLSLGEFKSANCRGQHCVAAGYYENGPDFYPLLATSANAGQTWNYTIDSNTPTLADLISGYFNSANCSGQNCIAAGVYSTSTTDYPLLATSSDAGLTWNYTVNSTTPATPTGFVNGQFYQASCSGQNCIAAGSYSNGTTTLPLLATSANEGMTWSYTISDTTPTFTGLLRGELWTANCSEQNCVAAGYYFNGADIYPLLANSTNGGVTWDYTINNSLVSLPAGTLSGQFQSANCSGQNCIAAGKYINGTNTYPLVATSTNGGVTWNYTINSSSPSLPGMVSGSFNSANCSGQNCIAAGGYNNGTNNYPLLASSTNGGVTWSYTINSTTPTLPSDLVYGFFSSTSCNGQYCIAAGQYTTSTSQYPLLATSTNAGLTWAYTIDSTTPSLPSDYVSQGTFASTAISTSASLLPESLNFLKPQALSGY